MATEFLQSVDGAQAGFGAAPTLAEVLAAGNDTGGVGFVNDATGTPGTNAAAGTQAVADGTGSADTQSTATAIGSGTATATIGAIAVGGGTANADQTASADNALASAVANASATGTGTADATATASAAGGSASIGPVATPTTALVMVTGLPTSDPLVAGALYSDGVPSAGVPKPLMVSGG